MVSTPRIRSDSDDSVDQNTLRKPFETAIEEFKLKLLKDALQAAQFNQKKAAAIMGLTYHQFRGLYPALQETVVFGLLIDTNDGYSGCQQKKRSVMRTFFSATTYTSLLYCGIYF